MGERDGVEVVSGGGVVCENFGFESTGIVG